MRDLAEVLAYLYPEYSSIHRVLSFAGLDFSNVDVEGAALDVWLRILEEETKRGQRGRILLEAIREYPDNPQLVPAGIAYLNTVAVWELPRSDLSRRQWGFMALVGLIVLWLLVLSIAAVIG